MEKLKIYRVSFRVRCRCSGVFSYASGHLSVPAESKKDAIEILKNSITFELADDLEAKEINIWK